MEHCPAAVARAVRAKRLSEAVVLGFAAADLGAVATLCIRNGASVWFLVVGVLAMLALERVIALRQFAFAFRRHVIMDDEGIRKVFPSVTAAVARCAAAAGIVPPETCLLDDDAPSACSWISHRGRKTIGIRFSLLRTLPRRCVPAILAHEIAHIRNGDGRIASVYQVIVALLRIGIYLSAVWMGTMALFPGLAGRQGPDLFDLVIGLGWFVVAQTGVLLVLTALLIPWSFRKTEFAADMVGATLADDPVSLVMGLVYLDLISGDAGRREPWIARLTSSHPSTVARVRALMRMIERDDARNR